MKRAADKAKRRRAPAVEPYLSKWMTGAEALEYLLRIYEEPRSCFAHLRSAISEDRILGRWLGREREREFYVSMGLSLNNDRVQQVDASWRATFIYSDPALVDMKEFGEQSELLRENVVQTFPVPRMSKAQSPRKQMSGSQLTERVANFLREATESGTFPTARQIEERAHTEGWHVSRNPLRDEYSRQASAAGFEPKRGRPPKSRPNSPPL